RWVGRRDRASVDGAPSDALRTRRPALAPQRHPTTCRTTPGPRPGTEPGKERAMSQQEQDRASPTTAVAEGQILYTPPTAAVERCNMTRYVRWLAEHPKFGAPAFEDYFALQRWSIENPGTFWQPIAEYFEVQFHSPFRVALGKAEMPGTEWFPGATLNYAEHAL